MPPLPVLSGAEVRRVFEASGWTFSRQTGSHMILTKSEARMNLSVPAHREVESGTLRSLIRSSGLSVEEFETVRRGL